MATEPLLYEKIHEKVCSCGFVVFNNTVYFGAFNRVKHSDRKEQVFRPTFSAFYDLTCEIQRTYLRGIKVILYYCKVCRFCVRDVDTFTTHISTHISTEHGNQHSEHTCDLTNINVILANGTVTDYDLPYMLDVYPIIKEKKFCYSLIDRIGVGNEGTCAYRGFSFADQKSCIVKRVPKEVKHMKKTIWTTTKKNMDPKTKNTLCNENGAEWVDADSDEQFVYFMRTIQ